MTCHKTEVIRVRCGECGELLPRPSEGCDCAYNVCERERVRRRAAERLFEDERQRCQSLEAEVRSLHIECCTLRRSYSALADKVAHPPITIPAGVETRYVTERRGAPWWAAVVLVVLATLGAYAIGHNAGFVSSIELISEGAEDAAAKAGRAV